MIRHNRSESARWTTKSLAIGMEGETERIDIDSSTHQVSHCAHGTGSAVCTITGHMIR